jgi:hypothetical protein
MSAVDDIMVGIMVLYQQGGYGMADKPDREQGRMGFKKMPCSSAACSERRIHHERPDTPRGIQICTVKANHIGPAYCSLNCYFYGKGELKENENETTD